MLNQVVVMGNIVSYDKKEKLLTIENERNGTNIKDVIRFKVDKYEQENCEKNAVVGGTVGVKGTIFGNGMSMELYADKISFLY